MFYLLELREKIKKFYQEKEVVALAIFKFIISFIIFYTISHYLNYNSLFSNVLIILLLSLIGAFVPSSVLTFIAMVVACLEVFSFSSVLGMAVVGVLIILYCLFIRFTPKLGIAMLAVPIAFALNIPCLIPIVLGLVSTPISIVAVGCGTIIYYLCDAINNVYKMVGNNTSDGGQIYVYMMNQLKDNATIIFNIIVFILITLIVYVVRTREIVHAFEVAIVTGCIVNLLSFLIADLTNDIEIPMNIGVLILGTIGAGILAFIIQNFRCALDYTTIEKVQFEDDDYYYYVKAIPKIKVIQQKSDIKKISVQKPHKTNDDIMDGFDNIKDEDLANINNANMDNIDAYDEEEMKQKSIDEEINSIQKDIEENIAENIAEEIDEKSVFTGGLDLSFGENNPYKGDKDSEADDKVDEDKVDEDKVDDLEEDKVNED